MITMTLTDDTTSAVLQMLEVPLTVDTINNDVEVITLDNDITIYMYPNSDKRVWSHTWSYLSEDDYNTLKGFRDRQRTLFKFPRVTISDQDVSDIPVYMTLNPKNIIDHCGTVNDATVVLRESNQLPDLGS
jgi:hypothetical protein